MPKHLLLFNFSGLRSVPRTISTPMSFPWVSNDTFSGIRHDLSSVWKQYRHNGDILEI